MKLTHALAAVTVATTLALAPAVAHADSYTQTDAAGDVQGRGFDAPDSSFVTDPNRAIGDVVSSRVTHLGKVVRMKLKLRELTRSGRGSVSFFAIRTNNGLKNAYINATRGRWSGKTHLTNARDKDVACSGITHKLDYVANTALIVVPRSCLGNPRWVRVGLGMVTYSADTLYADDGRITGDVTRPGTYGPRVYQ